MSGRCQAPPGFVPGDVVGRGALTETFEVVRDGALFVCKRLVARALRDPDAVAALLDEASVLAALAGRGAPRLVDRGTDDAGPFVVMQHLEGASLATAGRASRESRDPRHPVSAEAAHAAWVARVARNAFRALASVHCAPNGTGALGLVHADLSTDNVVVGDDGHSVVLIDFGLARFRGALRPDTGAFRGTLAYASPELARGEPIDARADLFSLAAALLHAASGMPPRPGDERAALLMSAGEVPLDGYAVAAGVGLSPAVAAALARCVAFERDLRPARAEDVFGADPC